VVIGAGVRLPPSRLGVFEAVVNAVHRAAPRAAIAFNTRPEDTRRRSRPLDLSMCSASPLGKLATLGWS